MWKEFLESVRVPPARHALLVVCSGCASTPPTQAQARMERAFATCNAEAGGIFRLTHVMPDGRAWIEPKSLMAADDAEISEFWQCMRRHGGRVGGH
jgi:hypothetical protein